MLEKQKKRIRKLLEMKKNLADKLDDSRLKKCGICYTVYCPACEALAISKKFLSWQFCDKRICPVCQKILANKRSAIIAESVIELMEKQEKIGRPVIPCIITLTIPHNREDPLRALLLIITDAWKMLRNGGEKKEWLRNKRRGIIGYYRQHFIGETYSIELPFNQKNGWHVHIHALAMRYLDMKPSLGVCRWTGALIDEEGIRSLWHHYVKIAWRKRRKENTTAQENTSFIYRDFPEQHISERHIEIAYNKIHNADVFKFSELTEDKALTDNEKQTKLILLRKKELTKLEEDKTTFLGKKVIACQLDLKMLYYQNETGKKIPISWLIK